MKPRSLLRGTIILTASGSVSRVLGAVCRVLLVRIMGPEALGLYQLPFPLFLFGISAATLGLPVGLSRAVADSIARGDSAETSRLREVALRLTVLAAAAMAAALFVFAPVLSSRLLLDSRAVPVVRVTAVAVFFSCLSGTMRGYFHGRQDMVPSACSQLAEQLVRTAASLGLAWVLLPLGPVWAAVGAMGGIAVGEVTSVVSLTAWTRLRQAAEVTTVNVAQSRGTPVELAGQLLALSLPLALTRTFYSAGRTLEVGLITGSLQSTGLSASGATAAYGQLTGIAVPLLYLPTVFIFPLTTALLPSVAATAVKSPARLRKQVTGLLGVAVAVGVGAAIGLLVTSDWLATAVFEVPGAAHLIALVAVVAPAAYVEFVTTSVLNGLGETGVVFEHTAAGMLVRLALLQLLVTRPELGISGALYAYAAGHGLTAALNLTEVYRQVVLCQRAPSRT